MDTRPDDLIVTPVLVGDERIEYRASTVVTAMLQGGIAVLDEANRMSERSWASLAPLMDDRRYVESTALGTIIPAHSDFRLCATMNTDASVYELPGYIQSRLKPTIELVSPPWEIQERIVREKSQGVAPGILDHALSVLEDRIEKGLVDSVRDSLALVQYANKLRETNIASPVETAAKQVLGANHHDLE